LAGGTITLVLFPLAGLYMRYVALVPQLADAPRLVFRSRFLFLLFIGLANLTLSSVQPTRVIQRLVSAVVLAAPVPLMAAFLIDPGTGVQSSLLTTTTMRVLFVASVLLVFANRPRGS